MAVFGWPLMHLLRVKHHAPKCGIFLLLAFLASFGALLCVPVIHWHMLHNIVAAIFCISAVLLHCVLLRNCGQLPMRWCKFLTAVAIVAFTSAFLEIMVSSITGSHVPWLSWVLVSSGLTAVSLFPWFYEKESLLQPRAHGLSIVDLAESYATILTFIGAMLPVVYIWSLPALAYMGFAHKCEGLPRCKHDQSGGGGQASVSNFIANPQATGMMAATCVWPIYQMWSIKHHAGRWGFVLIIIFWTFFGAFLAAPCTKFPMTHNVVVGIFCLCGLIFQSLLHGHCRKDRLVICTICLSIGVASLMGVIVTGIIAMMGEFMSKNLPWMFYSLESTGLTAIAIFPWLYKFEKQHIFSEQ